MAETPPFAFVWGTASTGAHARKRGAALPALRRRAISCGIHASLLSQADYLRLDHDRKHGKRRRPSRTIWSRLARMVTRVDLRSHDRGNGLCACSVERRRRGRGPACLSRGLRTCCWAKVISRNVNLGEFLGAG